ncbi:MAG: T9SS type A sorting domain-containing protein [Saprospiraceae bacterium]
MKKLNMIFSLLLFFSCSCLFAQNFDIYVSDIGGFTTPDPRILKFDSSGMNGEIFISENLSWPQDIVFLEDKNEVLISNLNSGRITRYHADSGDYISNFATGLGGPTRMKIRNDTLYVLQWNGNGKVMRFTLEGIALGAFTDTGVPRSIGLDWDAEGNLYVSSYGQTSPSIPTLVRKYDTQGIDQGNFIGSTNLAGPTNIWFDPSGNGDLLVSDYNSNRIKRFNSSGAYLNDFITGLNLPEGVDFDSEGNIYIGNGGTDAVKKYTSDGQFIIDIVPSGSLEMDIPNVVILRETSTVSVKEIEKKNNFILPTVGTEFFLDSKKVTEVLAIEIFNTAGVLVAKSKAENNKIWNANGYAEGMYIIRAKTNDGIMWTQKVMVKKE